MAGSAAAREPGPTVAFAPGPIPNHEPGKLFEEVVRTLKHHYYDEALRRDRIPELATFYRPAAESADSLHAERTVVHAFLSEIAASHLALYSKSTYRALSNELSNRKAPTLGFNLVQREGKLFAHRILDGGPAAVAGLLRWDRIVEVDGVPVEKSRRLDWRSDDAYLPDPPVHQLLCKGGEVVALLVERRPGRLIGLEISARRYTGIEAAAASSRVIEHGKKRFGYIHFWYIHHEGVSGLLKKKLRADFADCHGLILDLRGRGGSMSGLRAMLATLARDWSPRPMAALVDAGSRSAKEIIAFEIQRYWLGIIVGEHTAGAVLPASFRQVGPESYLMFPAYSLGAYSRALEGVGVRPDIPARDGGPYSAGADPILDAGIAALAGGVCRI